MGPKYEEPQITETIVEHAKRRVAEVGRFELERQMKQREPHLYSALCAIANAAPGEQGETLSDPTLASIRRGLAGGDRLDRGVPRRPVRTLD
jgi:hypothetical protein